MKLYEITEKIFNLKRAIAEKSICPADVVDATVRIHNTRLEIILNKVFDNGLVPDETVLFFWDYSGERPFVVRETEVKNGSIFLEVERTLLFQMLLLDLDSIRIGIAFRLKNEYFCGYCRNTEAKKEELQSWDRSICKLASIDKAAFVAYWTEGGILSVRFRDEKKFDDEFYRIRMSGYYWENEKLTVYLEAPLMAGAMKIKMYSMSTQAVCRGVDIRIEREGNTGLKSIWKMIIDLSNMPSGDSDGYRLLCELDGHSFRVFIGCEVDEDASCKITLKTDEQLNVCIIQNSDGRFILKTGRVYPVMLSVVTAVYNTAPFLAEMINSVLSQNVGKLEEYCRNYQKDYYKDIFELILVDDGSTDGSGDILDDYARISNKIRVIHKENGGVSSARNAGIEVARGKYINFTDSDDKLSENFMEECLLFFESKYDSLSVCKTPMMFFDAINSAHWANYQFTKENCSINPLETPDLAFHNVNSCIFKVDDVKNKMFDTTLSIGEDMLFVNEIIIAAQNKVPESSLVGLIGNTCYYYRKRSSGETSAMDKNRHNEDTYITVLKKVFERILLTAEYEYGYILKWVQYSVMGQLQWRFLTDDKGEAAKKTLGDKKFLEYKEKAFSLLQYIDDDVIMAQKKIWSEHKYYILQKKYGLKPRFVRENNDIYFDFNGTRISTSFGRCYVRIEFLDITRGILHMEGFSMNFMPEAELLIFVNGEEIIYDVGMERDINKYIFDETVFYATTFSTDIPLEDGIERYEIQFHGRLDGIEVSKSDLRFAKTMPLAQSYKNSFYTQELWTVRKEDNRFIVYNMSFVHAIGIDFEKEFEDEIINSKNKDIVKDILELRRQALFRIAGKNKKKIWLISDRINVARDNGEAIFIFLSTNYDYEVEPYFIIDANSPDFVRMQSYGKVVPYGSKQHYLMHLIADCIVSSAADEFVINPWDNNNAKAEIVRDFLARPKFIFLQHGVTKNDISGWLNRYNKNIIGFVCAAQREAQSILDYNYYYNSENVWLTGFPRHDRLYHEEKKYITIMPTWRKWLGEGRLNKPGKNFNKSDYFRFYNDLINCSRLLDAADSYGYTICFMPHPIVQNHMGFFDKDDRVIFFSTEKSYSEIYAESNLVITDYSSACMDFALLRKPVVYCQFDEKQFFEEHTVKHGYFDYAEDGFGEVTYDMDTLIDVIISYMKNGCKVHEPYGSRMDNFFAFHDYNNCERVYKKIKELDG